MLDSSSFRVKLQRTLQYHMGGLGPSNHSDPISGVCASNECSKLGVLSEIRAFTRSPIRARLCTNIITRILRVLDSQESFNVKECSDIFFNVTRLFQCSDSKMRRMVYALLKHMNIQPDVVFVITSCILKDVTCDNDDLRVQAYRALGVIGDVNMALQVERFLKTSILDKNTDVAAAAVICAVSLWRCAPDVIKRLGVDTVYRVSQKDACFQVYALMLLKTIKGNDTVAYWKFVGDAIKISKKTCMSYILLIDYTKNVLIYKADGCVHTEALGFLLECVRSTYDSIILGASRALFELYVACRKNGFCGFSGLIDINLENVFFALEMMSNSNKSSIRFAAVRTLHYATVNNISGIEKLSSTFEGLLSDVSRGVCTMALTCLLKIGSEGGVDTLLTHLSEYMSDITDAFKCEVCDAILTLCIKYPHKHKVLLRLLGSCLREEGALEFKCAVVHSIFTLIEKNVDARECAVMQLCEFIEDCEYTQLSMIILNFLGRNAYKYIHPRRYIRFIFNRIILERATIRAAGVDALAAIALHTPEVANDIFYLLQDTTNDQDDDVRDLSCLYTAAVYAHIQHQQQLHQNVKDLDLSAYDDICTFLECESCDIDGDDIIKPKIQYSVDYICDDLYNQFLNGVDDETQYDFKIIPMQDVYMEQQLEQQQQQQQQQQLQQLQKMQHHEIGPLSGDACGMFNNTSDTCIDGAGEDVINIINNIVEPILNGDHLGAFLCSSVATNLTESEAEYSVKVVRHFFENFIVLRFIVTNTVQGHTLTNIHLRLQEVKGSWLAMGSNLIPELEYAASGDAYVVIKNSRNDGLQEPACLFCTLVYILKEDGDDIGVDDEYSIEPLHIHVLHFLAPRPIRTGVFEEEWSMDYINNENVSTLVLGNKSLDNGVQTLIDQLHAFACDKTGTVPPGSLKHTLHMSCVYMSTYPVLAKAQFIITKERGCVMRIYIRSPIQSLPNQILDILN